MIADQRLPIPEGEGSDDERDEEEGEPLRPLQVVCRVEVPPPSGGGRPPRHRIATPETEPCRRPESYATPSIARRGEGACDWVWICA